MTTNSVLSCPESLRVGLVPAQWEPETQRHVYDLRTYPASRRYPVDTVELNEHLARFFGYYVAGGSSAKAERPSSSKSTMKWNPS